MAAFAIASGQEPGGEPHRTKRVCLSVCVYFIKHDVNLNIIISGGKYRGVASVLNHELTSGEG